MKRMRVHTQDIEEVYLSGAFGNYINPENAMTIGLLPELDPSKMHSIGHRACEKLQNYVVDFFFRGA